MAQRAIFRHAGDARAVDDRGLDDARTGGGEGGEGGG
jgi:hypothetical protein